MRSASVKSNNSTYQRSDTAGGPQGGLAIVKWIRAFKWKSRSEKASEWTLF